MRKNETSNGKKGGLLKGKPHYDKNGKPLGGIKAIVTDTDTPVELEGGEVIINKHASKKYWKELSKINQSAGNGVPIHNPNGNDDEDPEEYKDGGRIIDFNPNHLPNKRILTYAKKIKSQYPKVWDIGGNIFGNEAFKNLQRVSERGYWLESEKWMYIKWRSFVARHTHDFRIKGVIAMLKWVDKVDKGWEYMKNLIEAEIEKKYPSKMAQGGGIKNDCIDFIENTESVAKNGYYLHFKNLNKYIEVGDKTIQNIQSFVLITYNSGGQSNLKASDSIIASELSSEIANLLDCEINTAYIIVSEQIKSAKKFSLGNLKNIENENIVIADKDKIVCTNIETQYAKGGDVKTYKNKFNKKYGFKSDKSHSLEDIANLTKIKLSALQDIYNKGIGAYKTNPESVRPTVHSKEQWAMGRVYSAVMGGKASRIDKNELIRGKMAKGGSISYADYKKSQFNEEEDRYLPSGYLEEFQIQNNTIENYPILIKKINGLEYRKRDNSLVLGVFDDGKQVADADNKAVQVAKEYQKKGIGVELVHILKELNPNHRFGSMTPEGFNLMGSYYDKKVAIKKEKGGLIAPNGKQSNLNAEQYKLVRTKSFKKWFGDWENDPENASKVVDENGEPLVVYRGSKSKTPNYIPHKHNYSDGIYFSSKKEVANLYITSVWQNWEGRVFDCFLNIRKLKIYDTLELKSNLYQEDYVFYNNLAKQGRKDNFDGLRWDNFIDVPDLKNIFPKEPIDFMATTFIVYEPNQIKFADGSNTTFDGSNTDIRFKDGGSVLIAPNGKQSNLNSEQYKLVRTKDFKKWFGDWENDPKNASKVLDENGEPLVVYHGTKKYNRFNVFKKGSKGYLGGGIYFTSDKEKAKNYGQYGTELINFYEVFLRVVNPIKVNGGTGADDLLNQIYNSKKIYLKRSQKQSFDTMIVTSADIKKLRDKGFDGIFWELADEFVVYESNQIKLADGTNTTFDSDSNDIRYDGGGELAKGIKAEKEHISTARKLYNHEITPEQSAKEIALDHLKENSKYYTELAKLEKKFERGGSIENKTYVYPSSSKPIFWQMTMKQFCDYAKANNLDTRIEGTNAKLQCEDFYKYTIVQPLLSDKADRNVYLLAIQSNRMPYELVEEIIRSVGMWGFNKKVVEITQYNNQHKSNAEIWQMPKDLYLKKEVFSKNYSKEDADKWYKEQIYNNVYVVDVILKNLITRGLVKYSDVINRIRESIGIENLTKEQVNELDNFHILEQKTNAINKLNYLVDLIESEKVYTSKVKTETPTNVEENNYLSANKIDFIETLISDIKNDSIKHNKISVEKLGKKFGIEEQNTIKELAELSISIIARDLAHDKGLTDEQKYYKIVDLYKIQPNLSHRTSQSFMMQQYSTPAPIGYLMGLYCGINKEGVKYFEPSAGNGLLTSAGHIDDATLNELDKTRNEDLHYLGFKNITNLDASKPFPQYEKKFDAVLTNPPFGSVDSVFYGKYEITSLEQLMALRGLDTMKDDGKSAIIIGGWMEYDSEGRLKAGKNRTFFVYLWENYNIEDIININGQQLYSRQGTAFPTRLILINGRKKEQKGYFPLLDKELHKLQPFSNQPIMTFEELWKRVNNFIAKPKKVYSNQFEDGNTKKTKEDWLNYKSSFFKDTNSESFVKQSGSKLPEDADYDKMFEITQMLLNKGKDEPKTAVNYAEFVVIGRYYDPNYNDIRKFLGNKMVLNDVKESVKELLEYGYDVPKDILDTLKIKN